MVYHVLNRANARMTPFEDDGDYGAFEKVLTQAHEHVAMRTVSYCVMPNHWHLILWPRGDGDLSRFMHWLTLAHTQRWHAAHETTGSGHVYQGRFKSFPVQSDAHFLTVCRYVERNPLRAGLVARAEQWRWGSLWRRTLGDDESKSLLSPGPLAWPKNWLDLTNTAQTAAELEAVRLSVSRGRPLGGRTWQKNTAKRVGLESTLRTRGRPRKDAKAGK